MQHASELIAVDGDTAIAHWNVRTRDEGDPVTREWDGILVLRFAPDGRCAEHREWFATVI